MNWRKLSGRKEPQVPQPQILVVVGREPTGAELEEFKSVIRADEGAEIKDAVGNILVDVRVGR